MDQNGEMKVCSGCNRAKPEEAFYKTAPYRRFKNNLSSRCKECQREAAKQWGKENPEKKREREIRRILKVYGTTLEERDRKLVDQAGLCKICGNPMEKVCQDHDHSTGKARGLLCNGCNTGLGQFKDCPDLLRSAILYLKLYGKE